MSKKLTPRQQAALALLLLLDLADEDEAGNNEQLPDDDMQFCEIVIEVTGARQRRAKLPPS
jgi:hypothetical protein